MRAWASLILTGLVSACGSGLPDVDCSGTVPAFDEVTALKKCSACHSSTLSGAQRHDAPSGVNFDTEAAARAKAQDAAEEVNGGDMPPSGSGISLSADEKTQLYKWALCK